MSGVDKLIEKEQMLRDTKSECTQLQYQIKTLRKEQSEREKALVWISEGDQYTHKIKSLVQEVRIWKGKIERSLKRHATAEEVQEKQQELIKDYEQKIKDTQAEIDKEMNEGKGKKKGDQEPAKSSPQDVDLDG